MPKSALFFLILVFPIIGLSQSARKTNKLLQSEYTALLKTYDSLYLEHTTLFDAAERKYREIETAAKPVRRELKDVGVMHRQWTHLSYDLSLLDIDHSSDSILNNECKALEVKLDEIAQKLTNASKDRALDEKMNFQAVSPGKGSMKKQNAWLTESITEVSGKNQSLLSLNSRLRLANTTFEWSYQAVADVSKTLDSLAVVFEKEIKSLKEQKEQARNNYALKGPKGFNENYAKVFPAAFAPKVVENERIDTRTTDYGRWEPDVIPPPERAPINEDKYVHDFVDEPAEFPGGMAKLKEFIKANLKYPTEAAAMRIEGKCYLQFTVDTLGKVSNVKVKRGVPDCPECDKEAIRMAESMPDWIPGKNNGKPVNSLFNLPVAFKLTQN